MTLIEIAALLGFNLAATLIVMLVLGLWAVRRGRIGLIDAVWPLVLAGLAAATYAIAEGDPIRKGLLLWLVGLWALPQAWRRLAPETRRAADVRYAALAADAAARLRCRPALAALLMFFLPQGALAWLTALPVQLGQIDFLPPVGRLGWTGAVLAVLGIGLEGLGGLRRPGVSETALPPGPWTWLRRPDHLGDLAVWWGLFLIAAETMPGRASVVGPIFLTGLIAHWIRTGANTENPRRVSDGG